MNEGLLEPPGRPKADRPRATTDKRLAPLPRRMNERPVRPGFAPKRTGGIPPEKRHERDSYNVIDEAFDRVEQVQLSRSRGQHMRATR